jgi:hypothetical protein
LTVQNETPLRSLAVKRDGTILYAVTYGNIVLYDPSGTEIATIEHGENWLDDIFLAPNGDIITYDGASYDTIYRLNQDGDELLKIEKGITSRNELGAVSNVKVVVDGLGNFYVLSAIDPAVFKFSPNGDYVDRFGQEGDATGDFTSPYAMTIDNQGRLYISDFDGIMVFNSNGTYIDTIRVSSYVYGMTFAPDGKLWAVTGSKVYRFKVNE